MLVTALWTPFLTVGGGPDLELFQRLAGFQLAEGAQQLLLGGTTGEGASLTDDERLQLLDALLDVARPEQILFGLGTGRVEDVIARGRAAMERGVLELLLVDCPYSGASSAALREHWHGPVAAALPDSTLLPYAVPGRTGTELLPDDLARLAEQHPNVRGVKDASGRIVRMLRVRELCGDDFRLLCGDDVQACEALLDPAVRADGVVSVAANLAPRGMRKLVDKGLAGDASATRVLSDSLHPLFGLISVTAQEQEEGLPATGAFEPAGADAVPQRSRNPVPLKEALGQLGLSAVSCRAPLGAMGRAGRRAVADILSELDQRAPDLLTPLSRAFDLNAKRPVPRTTGGVRRGAERELAGRLP